MAWNAKGVALQDISKHQDAIMAYQNFIKFAPPEEAELVEEVKTFIRQLGGKV